MTSASFNVGLMNDNRNSSRVLKPPGGGHTDIFGAPEPVTPKPTAKASQISQIFGNDDQNSNCASIKRNQLKSSIVFSHEENENKIQTTTTTTEVIEQKTETKTEDNVDNKATEDVKEAQKPKRVPPGGYSTSFW